MQILAVSRLIGRALIGLCTLLALARAAPLEFGLTKHVPRTFTDDLLDESQRQGQLVAHLGRVMLLDTFMAPTSIGEIRTTFSIFNNWNEPKRAIRIRPDTWASLGMADYEQFGPYHFDLDNLLGSGYDAAKRTVIMIPGYFSPEEVSWVRLARNHWLELERELNVIEVSWSDSNQCTYSRAVANTVLVARQVTIFLHYLAELSGASLRDESFLGRLHIIGHSLGAHIAGFVGQDLGGRLGRITALDPAGPTFDQFKPNQRLDRNDARLVEVLHTNSGQMKYLNLLASAPLHALSSISFVNQLSSSMANSYTGEGNTAWFGIEAQLGHVDYYANNGRVQAGCHGILHICDHKRARDIYVDLLAYENALRRSESGSDLLLALLETSGGDANNNNNNSNNNNNNNAARLKSQMNRLYAFKSADYESFASGANLMASCPELMSASEHLDDQQVLKSFRNCSIPLPDFTRPLDELIEELQSVYNVNFDRDNHEPNENGTLVSLSSQRPGYYFKTSPERGRLVGDHYLLKIYLLDEPQWDAAACTLQTELLLSDDTKIELHLSRLIQATPGVARVLAMPFVHLDNLKAKQQFNNLTKLIALHERESSPPKNATVTSSSQYRASPEFVQTFQELFPKTIVLSLAEPKSTSVFGTVKNMTVKMIKSNEELAACRLSIRMVEVHPIVYGLRRNFGALYGGQLFLGQQLNQPLALLSPADQLRRLEAPNEAVAAGTTLSADSISSFSVGLEAALVG